MLGNRGIPAVRCVRPIQSQEDWFSAHWRNRESHPAPEETKPAAGWRMVEVSRDGKRVYFTNSLYATWDEQFYPDGVGSWMVKLEADPQGGIRFDENFFVENSDYRVHQIRLEGGDSSSDSFCFP